jgi:hypothetical protein
VTPITDQVAGLTRWHAVPAGATVDNLLKFGTSDTDRAEIRKIADPGQFQALILAVLINYTVSDPNTIDWIHQMQLQGYVDALCWSFRNQTLLNQTWHLDADQQEIVFSGLAFISGIRGRTADETLTLYKTFNIELDPKAIDRAHWLQQPWAQSDSVSCEMLDFINYLSRKSEKGIVFTPGEPARALILPGSLPLSAMKCTWITRS